MRAITAIGIGGAFVALLLAVLMEGGNPAALINIPAAIISILGTICATAASTNMAMLKRMPKLAILSFKPPEFEPHAAAEQMVKFSEKARRDGLLALEKELKDVDDEYTRKGLQLVVDGTDSELVRTILQSEIDGMQQRHKENAHIWATAGGFAPTLGIIGTVLSLVHVLENLSSPASLGHSIAGAFLATLYGVGSANLLYLPIGNKLKEMSAEEMQFRYMLLEGVLSIQAGDNPRMLAEKLDTFLPPGERGGATVHKAPVAAAAAPAAAAEAA